MKEYTSKNKNKKINENKPGHFKNLKNNTINIERIVMWSPEIAKTWEIPHLLIILLNL